MSTTRTLTALSGLAAAVIVAAASASDRADEAHHFTPRRDQATIAWHATPAGLRAGPGVQPAFLPRCLGEVGVGGAYAAAPTLFPLITVMAHAARCNTSSLAARARQLEHDPLR